MRDKLGDEIRLLHMWDAIEEIKRYTADIPFKVFTDNSMMKFAVVKQLEIIGEAANHLSESTLSQPTEIDWSKIIGARNIFVHEYFVVDDIIVWDIIKNDLPKLETHINKLLAQF
jgi:uncharacterized protein with HEPN domain